MHFQTIIVQKTQAKQYPDSWPTLEILPGGVIKNADKYEDNGPNLCSNEGDNDDDKMYACAKCPQKFKFLFCLVKHVKWHEDQKKREKISEFKISKLLFALIIIYYHPLIDILDTNVVQ